jgi:hypothetical protein
MEMKFAISLSIAIVYVLFKIVEMKIIDTKKKPLKPIFKDSIIVFMSCLFGFFIMDQVDISPKDESIAASNVFVDNPDF